MGPAEILAFSLARHAQLCPATMLCCGPLTNTGPSPLFPLQCKAAESRGTALGHNLAPASGAHARAHHPASALRRPTPRRSRAISVPPTAASPGGPNPASRYLLLCAAVFNVAPPQPDASASGPLLHNPGGQQAGPPIPPCRWLPPKLRCSHRPGAPSAAPGHHFIALTASQQSASHEPLPAPFASGQLRTVTGRFVRKKQHMWGSTTRVEEKKDMMPRTSRSAEEKHTRGQATYQT
ncbi:hypothetical protein NDU88_004460 [Pleurodeles waltl]|uniref:Uncharacterized protein n=1 Tax=Pleurodeles waltl TaxID=8319 RepID=A0AAV7ME35_PLEWA|nr:hypothetical protein NDU88_004460 [Pleurodeles waltl]